MRGMITALYDEGWTGSDKQALMDEYGLTEEEAWTICLALDAMEKEREKRRCTITTKWVYTQSGGDCMVSESTKKSIAKYDKQNTKQYQLKLNRNTDLDILTQLEMVEDCGLSKQGYIKELIRQDIEARKAWEETKKTKEG